MPMPANVGGGMNVAEGMAKLGDRPQENGAAVTNGVSHGNVGYPHLPVTPWQPPPVPYHSPPVQGPPYQQSQQLAYQPATGHNAGWPWNVAPNAAPRQPYNSFFGAFVAGFGGQPPQPLRQHTLLNDIASCRSAVAELLCEAEVAVDVEGVDLCRHGRIALVQVCSAAGHVYLFDITALGASAFEAGGLRMLLETWGVVKVVFDGRNDCDALFHIFWVRMRNVYDLQVLHALKYSDSEDRYLKGFKECLKNACADRILEAHEQLKANHIKDHGKQLFSPAYGGSYAMWEARPLCQALVDYAVSDVRHMLTIKRRWSSSRLDALVRRLTEERVDRAMRQDLRAKHGRQMCERDFPLTIPEFIH